MSDDKRKEAIDDLEAIAKERRHERDLDAAPLGAVLANEQHRCPDCAAVLRLLSSEHIPSDIRVQMVRHTY